MSDLITSDRARNNLNNASTTTDEDATLADLVSACSTAIQRYCRREFVAQTFDQVYQLRRSDWLILDEYPLLKTRLKGFRHCYGQPPEVRRAFEQAMGIGE